MTKLFLKPFTFNSCRFEEWQAGQCISKGKLNITIVCKIDIGKIKIQLDGNLEGLNIPKNFDFNINESTTLPDGRIQYLKAPGNDFNPTIPIVCHLFVKNQSIDYVRFAMTAPDRILEFYNQLLANNH